jgi:hypothetical protein
MATISATITVDFIANYAGPHRVCFRIQGSGDPYDCTTLVNCVGGATACQAIINTLVNSTSCDGTVIFEGYIQAACEDVLSTSGRLPWTANFVPNVVCERYEVLCARGGIQAVNPNPAGQEYLVADALTIVRNGADPETLDGTISIATVGTGVINSISSLLAGGTLYTALDVLTINGSAGAGATIRVDTIGGGGEILTYTLLTNGAGYIGPFTFSGGTGSGANFDIVDGVDYDTFGSILTVTVSVPGLYSIPPTVTITTGTGAGAQLDVVLEPCAIYTNVGVDCVGGDQVDIADGDLDVGETFATCIEGGLAGATPSVYDVTQSGCCIPEDSASTVCTDVHLENASGGPVDVHVTECNGNDRIVTVPDATTEALCLIADGWIDPDVVGFTITDQTTPCT